MSSQPAPALLSGKRADSPAHRRVENRADIARVLAALAVLALLATLDDANPEVASATQPVAAIAATAPE